MKIYPVKLTRDVELTIRLEGCEHVKMKLPAGIIKFNTFRDACNYVFAINADNGQGTAIRGQTDSSGETHYI